MNFKETNSNYCYFSYTPPPQVGHEMLTNSIYISNLSPFLGSVYILC